MAKMRLIERPEDGQVILEIRASKDNSRALINVSGISKTPQELKTIKQVIEEVNNAQAS